MPEFSKKIVLQVYKIIYRLALMTYFILGESEGLVVKTLNYFCRFLEHIRLIFAAFIFLQKFRESI